MLINALELSCFALALAKSTVNSMAAAQQFDRYRPADASGSASYQCGFHEKPTGVSRASMPASADVSVSESCGLTSRWTARVSKDSVLRHMSAS
jgi:hypothetical protein